MTITYKLQYRKYRNSSEYEYSVRTRLNLKQQRLIFRATLPFTIIYVYVMIAMNFIVLWFQIDATVVFSHQMKII